MNGQNELTKVPGPRVRLDDEDDSYREFFDRRRHHKVRDFVRCEIPSLVGSRLLMLPWLRRPSFPFEVLCYAAEKPSALSEEGAPLPWIDNGLILPDSLNALVKREVALAEFRKAFCSIFASDPDGSATFLNWYRERIKGETDVRRWLFDHPEMAKAKSPEIIQELFPRWNKCRAQDLQALRDLINQERTRLRRARAVSRMSYFTPNKGDERAIAELYRKQGGWDYVSWGLVQQTELDQIISKRAALDEQIRQTIEEMRSLKEKMADSAKFEEMIRSIAEESSPNDNSSLTELLKFVS